MKRLVAGAFLALAMAGSSGCATTTPATEKTSPIPGGPVATTPPRAASPSPTPAPASPMPGTPVGTTASGGVIVSGNRPLVTDSLPSADAKTVLETIPEPLPPDQRIPPKAGAVTMAPAVLDSDSAARDSTGSRSDDVPVPQPTEPIGDRPGSAPSGSAAPPPPPPPPSSSPTDADCWRIQVAAVPESDRAARLKGAAESQLGVAFEVKEEKSLHKVRSRDCRTTADAEALRKRAIAVGFSGAFRIRDPKK